MKTRKIFALLICITMVMAFAACNTAQPAPSTAPSSAAPADPAPAPAPDPAPEGSKLEGELVFWTMWNDTEPQAEAWKDVAAKFEAAYPGTKVSINFVGRDISKTLKPALEAGTVIDVFDYPTQYGGSLGFYVDDLTEAVAKQYDCLGGKSIADVVLPSMLETPKKNTDIWAGQVAVGYKPWIQLVMYNVKAFEDAGITAPPATWDEFDAACAKIKAAGYSPLTFDDAYAHWLPGIYLQRAKGQDWVKELVNDKTGEMWRDPAVKQMADAYADFAGKGYFDANVGTNKWPAGQMDVGLGTAAMYFNLSGLPSEVADVAGPDFKWGGFNFPNVPNGPDNSTAAAASVTMTAINKACANKDLAYEFLAFIHSDESDARFVESGMTTASKTGNWPTALEGLKSEFDRISVILQPGGGIETNADAKPIVAANFIKLASGQMTADQFVEAMATETVR